jgi:predicted ribosome quality control (RQC) complex YloA/Tae2 family protein
MGATYANEILERLDMDKESLPDKDKVSKIYSEIKGFIQQDIDTRIIRDVDMEDVVPFEMGYYNEMEQLRKESFNEAVDEYFTKLRNEGEKSEATKDYKDEVRRLERVIEKQNNTVEEMQKSVDKFKEIGDKVYAKFQDIEAVLNGIREAKTEGTNWVEFSESNGLKVVDPAERKIEVDGIGIYIDKSVTENAALYYEKSKKAKSKWEGAEEALKESKRALHRAKEREVKVEKKLPDSPKERHKPEWYEKFRWFISSDGFLVIGGKDATTNEMIIKKHTKPDDLVFHSTVHGAPFFVIQNPDSKEIPESTINETAEAAASYSSAWGAGWGSADVYSVKPDQLSKTPQSGEYLSKGAFVVRGEREWYKGIPLKIAVGFSVDGYALAIGGPENAVASRAKHHVNVGVGNMKSGKLAKEIKSEILRQTNKEDGQKIKKVDLGEIQKWIPAGKGMLLK